MLKIPKATPKLIRPQGLRLGAKALEAGASTHFIQTFKMRFQQTYSIDQNVPKNAYFLQKISKVRLRASVSPRRLEAPPPDYFSLLM